jgi:hypothetical protein
MGQLEKYPPLPYDIDFDDENDRKTHHQVKYKVDMTMFDGKVVNALINTKSTQSCNVCGAKPSEMNNVVTIRGKKSITMPFLWVSPHSIVGFGLLIISVI